VTLEDAEKGIAKILAELEQSTGALVENVEISTIDVTSISSRQREYMLQVRVNFKRVPGHQWGQLK
jgi:hypothetical protein